MQEKFGAAKMVSRLFGNAVLRTINGNKINFQLKLAIHYFFLNFVSLASEVIYIKSIKKLTETNYIHALLLPFWVPLFVVCKICGYLGIRKFSYFITTPIFLITITF